MAADGRVRVTLPARYRGILQRHKGTMSDSGFLAWVLDNIDRGVLAVGVEPPSAVPAAVVPVTAAEVPPPRVLSVVNAPEKEDEFEDVI